ncbi:sensor histidine kinase [Spirochaeta africana]|uniref:Signal transduction histidine-protein kinase/phosphatase MprB n=1 Tax=Spirochaeta africana (strain ATCC 700263 / DSM 8902 / Z-7692) TaxID=889378 RepID=H9UFZ3_SPIAZ|nr:HAMP domain-containing sensor histidine kinase [Spirochaeta africana]AFG36436.1 signal transduction histidine kinase [Spirochaeta africana DSM 8902]
MTRQITVLGYSFRLMLLSVLIVVVVFAAIMSMALQRAINDWNTIRNQNLQTTIGAAIAQNYRLEGSLSPELLQQVLRPMLSPTVYVVVADSERNPLYAFVRGERVPLHPESTLDSVLQQVAGTVALPNVLLDGDEIFGYVAAGSLGFASDPLNLRFLRSLGFFLSLGVGLAIGVGLLSAFLLSRMLSNHARRVSGFLARIAAGERDIELPAERVHEFQNILESVRGLQQQLKREEELRRHWARDVAHDLRTPITALQAQFEAMQQGIVPATAERLASLRHEVARIERLVLDLRALNTMEEPQHELHPEWLDAEDFLRTAIASFGVGTGAGRFRLACTVDRLYADPHALQRAVMNLMQNAVQHGTPGTDIGIALRPTGASDPSLILEICNAGGVPAQDLPYVFERLYRGEDSRTTPGSGLGLSIAKAIIERHGGRIELDSDGSVTTVTVLLPNGG